MSFLGVENEKEFFTQHYLTAILQGDLRPLLESWRTAAKEGGPEDASDSSAVSRRTPPQALAASQREFFRYLDRLEHEAALDARVAEHFEMACRILGGLGYADVLAHRIASLPSGQVPLYGEIKQADGSPILWLLPVVAPQASERGTLAGPIALAQLAAARSASQFQGELRPTGEVFGDLAAHLKTAGSSHRYRVQDIWLASQAIQHGYGLLTRNKKDFDDIPGLDLIVCAKRTLP